MSEDIEVLSKIKAASRIKSDLVALKVLLTGEKA